MIMKRLLTALLLTSVVFSCQQEDSDLNPEPGKFIKDILVYFNNNDQPVTKYQFQNDGEHYTNVAVFRKGANDEFFQPDPKYIISFQYDENGFIKQIDEKQEVNDYAYTSYLYSIEDGALVYQEFFLVRIGFERGKEVRRMFYQDPEDGFYEFEDQLYQFQNGNLVSFGTINEFDGGDLDQFNRKWDVEDLIYDDKPNVFADYAVNFVLGDKEMTRSLNRNNLKGIRERGENQNLPLMEFIYNGDKIESIINHETGAIAQFLY